ncbi:MAG: rhomboid family intramembrane serine protease [Desulfuromonadales bacterium]|nr:rhomboid family intramembrane serine protease [Desulfuromonadales bacterium]NIR33284.1 rhomboid family intramembrane serine protease [Desulfuromonadales bacterium]NIS40877.1 rhomboid family intramembrane serine protease [Desulfuromonadales bacterium]
MDGTRWQWRIRRWKRTLQGLGRGDQMPGSPTITVTSAIILVNLFLFALMVLWGAKIQGAPPLLNPRGELLVKFGAQFWPLVVYQNEWWRCLTYAFTHGGLIHIGFNMVVLYQVGPMLEFAIGPARYLFLYTFTALCATFAGYLWHPMAVVVGASGSLFGLIGFAIAYFHRHGSPAAIQQRNFMLQWAVLAFVFGFLVGADNAAHLGGALSGALLGWVNPLSVRREQQLRTLFNTLALLSAIAMVASLGMLIMSWFK